MDALDFIIGYLIGVPLTYGFVRMCQEAVREAPRAQRGMDSEAFFAALLWPISMPMAIVGGIGAGIGQAIHNWTRKP